MFGGTDPQPDSWPSWNQEQEDALRNALAGLEAKGDPLSWLDTVIDWDRFRLLLVQALAKSVKGAGGCPINNQINMYKLLLMND